MAFNINQFKANIQDFGYLKTNQYEVYIQPPKVLFGNALNQNGNATAVKNVTDMQVFRIDQIRAPGISLASADVSRYGVGPTQKQPFNAQYSEISFSVLCDEKAKIWQYWYNWLVAIFGFNGTEGALFAQAQQFPSYLSEYKENYSTIVQIVMYDQYKNLVQRINLYEAFPTALREVPLAWGQTGEMIKINVNMSYTEYTIVSAALENPVKIF